MASEDLYRETATLVLLLSVSGAVVIRSLMLRVRQRRAIEEAIRNGTYIPPDQIPRRQAPVKPTMFDTHLDEVDYSKGSEKGWSGMVVSIAHFKLFLLLCKTVTARGSSVHPIPTIGSAGPSVYSSNTSNPKIIVSAAARLPASQHPRRPFTSRLFTANRTRRSYTNGNGRSSVCAASTRPGISACTLVSEDGISDRDARPCPPTPLPTAPFTPAQLLNFICD